MAKDPAMLWYWSDWNSGTSLLSRFLKGCYMDLLHAQFNHGHLSLEEIKICLGSDFGTSWPALQKKFKQDEQGLFFNERLDIEKIKRQEFTKSRGENRSKSKNKQSYDTSYENHMKHHMENENRNTNVISDLLKKEQEEKEKKGLLPDMVKTFIRFNPTYHSEEGRDADPLFQISLSIARYEKITYNILDKECTAKIFAFWGRIAEFISKCEDYRRTWDIKTINNNLPGIFQSMALGNTKKQTNGTSATNTGNRTPSKIEQNNAGLAIIADITQKEFAHLHGKANGGA